MNKIFNFQVYVKPVPASRPVVTKNGTFYKKIYSDYKEMLTQFAKLAKSAPKSDKPLFLKCRFCFEVPKSWSKVKKANTYYHTGKPDLDNLVKALKDALNGVIYVDDAQVCRLDAEKHYGERNFVRCEVYELCD